LTHFCENTPIDPIVYTQAAPGLDRRRTGCSPSDMSYDQHIFIKMRSDLRDDLQAHYEKERHKQKEHYPFSHHIRQLLRLAMSRKPATIKAPANIDLTAVQIVQRIAGIWDEEMPQHISRISQRSDKRRVSIMTRWGENNDFECWRWAFRALAKDTFQMNRKNFSVEYILRPAHFAKWIDAGTTLKKEDGASAEFLDLLEGLDDED